MAILQSLIWVCNKCPSYEYFTLSQSSSGNVLHGTVIAYETLPMLINYRICCDLNWQTMSAEISQRIGGKKKTLTLQTNDRQNWVIDQNPQPTLSGLVDVDLEFSPSTNTLPIRRLNLKDNETKEVAAVWVRLNGLEIATSSQRYTKIDSTHYRYENPSLDFNTILEVDELGIIVRYGNLWQKIS